MTNAATTLPSENPFAQESTLPYLLPAFDRIKDEHFKPALIAGMARQQQEIEAIAANPDAASFDNTILAMERSGRLLMRVQAVFSNLAAANTNPAMEDLQSWAAAPLAAHADAIFLDPGLYARVHGLYERRAALELDAEALRLLERYETLFARAGAKLSPGDKERLKRLNEQLSSLTTEFSQQVLKGVNAAAVVVQSPAELDGLTDEQIAIATEAAKARGMPDQWVITLLNTTGQPPLSQLTNRVVRERIFKASIARGSGGPHDTTGLIAQIVKLRAERAALLGYANHAAYVLEDETAGTTAAVDGMLKQLIAPAMTNARKEAAAIQALIDQQAADSNSPSFRLEAWDWDFYAEQVRKKQFAFDEAEVRPYFEMERVLRDGVLFAATELFGITFKERRDLPVYQADVRVFEVFDIDGAPLGLFLADWYARDNKRGGAWMSTFVDQSRLLGMRSVVINNLNIAKPPPGQPTLLTFDEVATAFHEFGHALHSLLSDVEYPLFSGTNVPRDFVEFPSQYNEMWATDPRVLANYARHHRTGEMMPQPLMDKVLAASKFNQGYRTTEYLASALLDQAWHQLSASETPPQSHVAKFETAVLAGAAMDFPAVPPRYHSTYFSHIFTAPIGYSSGYYAYIWSEVLAADAVHWFKTHGGLTRANGQHLRRTILSKGFSADMMAIFEDFYGKSPDIEPLLEARGLTDDTSP